MAQLDRWVSHLDWTCSCLPKNKTKFKATIVDAKWTHAWRQKLSKSFHCVGSCTLYSSNNGGHGNDDICDVETKLVWNMKLHYLNTCSLSHFHRWLDMNWHMDSIRTVRLVLSQLCCWWLALKQSIKKQINRKWINDHICFILIKW